jgi:hypothetical protein
MALTKVWRCCMRLCEDVSEHAYAAKNTNLSRIFAGYFMLKRYLILLSAFAVLLSTMESCFLRKNRCDSCPGVAKHKKVRRQNKGSL